MQEPYRIFVLGPIQCNRVRRRAAC
ncbi:unnamed protein product [Linum tenue]|uniref:Uncharacterized protein n=1 Tax=Linum tenue TaxID=586396 RepID=A0AAV0K8F9_9ROSI|nr:unnamed protein product [Linum tenue]